MIAILWFFQIVYLDKFYKAIKTREAERVTEELIALLKENDDDMEAQIDEIAFKNNVSVLVKDTDGNSVYECEYIGTSKMKNIPEDELLKYYEEAKANNGSVKIEFEGEMNKTFNSDTIQNMNDGKVPPQPPNAERETEQKLEMTESVIYVNLVNSNGQELVLFLNTMLTPVGATVQTLQIQLGCITVILIGIALGIAILMSKRVSRSIIKVNESAKELAKGNYTVEFEGKDYKEIAELSDTLNYAAKELDKTEGFRKELLANVSHDLRTPLTMIIAYSEVMRDLPGENTPENIQVIIDESKRLTNLVNDMLDISKLQAGVLEKNVITYHLTESIQSVMERYHKLKEQDGYNIIFEYEEDVIVEADEYKIYQVIYNLVNNAINYTGKDKTVIVKQLIKGNKVRIEVSDSGAGIAKEDIPYVWERYYKVDKSHKRAITGTGLGLSIVKNILELHEADYGVKSEEGKGSTFWFELERKEL